MELEYAAEWLKYADMDFMTCEHCFPCTQSLLRLFAFHAPKAS